MTVEEVLACRESTAKLSEVSINMTAHFYLGVRYPHSWWGNREAASILHPDLIIGASSSLQDSLPERIPGEFRVGIQLHLWVELLHGP